MTIGKTLQLSPSQRSKKNLFLIAAEDHELTRRCAGFNKCKTVDEEGNITQKKEIVVEPMKEFDDKSHLLIARLLIDMVDDVAWAQVLNPTLEPKLFPKMRESEKQIEKTCRPLPPINGVIDSLEGNMYFTNIDLVSRYFQIAIEEDSQNLRAFITPLGLYK